MLGFLLNILFVFELTREQLVSFLPKKGEKIPET